ncbi:succinate dehydrogenase subunit 5, mitochondrial [Lactuca sativa]|uniref:Uncharacterized protein n=1 Tax=Lactuca sativa TaxID=4236 RepID=A0A9R1WX34_LACSA|nr:succinate dehydrogenase subunit 5, mitochondrial [Lactuca sativa]KAJ0189804.1 hypothetical protein LSAT_V11C800446240 [Lactuca sativa]
MEKLVMMRSLNCSIAWRSVGLVAHTSVNSNNQCIRCGIYYLQHPSSSMPHKSLSPFAIGIGSTQLLTDGGLTHLPNIENGDIKVAFKEFMVVNWAELPESVVKKSNQSLSKNTEDKASQQALANLLRVAEAVDEFTGFLVTLKMCCHIK